MAKTPAARLLLLTTLLQLLLCCSTTEPLHIHLSLDGKIDPRFKDIVFFKQVDAKDSDSKLADVKNQIKKNQHIRLYISGDFKATRDIPDDYYSEPILNPNGKDVAAIVREMIPPTAIGVVVFPTITQLFCGFKFLNDFENKIQSTHKDLSIGRETVHLYLTLDETFKDNAKGISNTFTQEKEDDKLISIAINKQLNFNNFVQKEWSTVSVVDSVYQVLIHEADTVLIRLVAKCTVADSKLKVGGFTTQELYKAFFKKVLIDNLRHPYQKIVTELPNDCGNDEQRKVFTEELVTILRKNSLDAFGKEPRAVLYIFTDKKEDGFEKAVEHRITSAQGENTVIYKAKLVENNNPVVTGKYLQKEVDMQELSIEFHCHGHFFGEQNSVCGLEASKLADKLNLIFNQLKFKSRPQTQMIFYACNVGTQKGQLYVKALLDKLDRDIYEVIAFKSWTSQQGSAPMVTVAQEDKFKASILIDNVSIKSIDDVDEDARLIAIGEAEMGKIGMQSINYAFGRFTARMRKSVNGGSFFSVLPKTELFLDEKPK